MIFEAILYSSETDLEFFYELRGEIINIATMLKELNYFYKHDKEAWIRNRGKAILREQKAEETNNIVKQWRLDLEEKLKQNEFDPGEDKHQIHNQRAEQHKSQIGQHKTDEQNEKHSHSNKDALVPTIEDKSRHDYAAYAYLVLKVHLEHPFLYKLINVHIYRIYNIFSWEIYNVRYIEINPNEGHMSKQNKIEITVCTV
jgi:hypothetical protein